MGFLIFQHFGSVFDCYRPSQWSGKCQDVVYINGASNQQWKSDMCFDHNTPWQQLRLNYIV